MILLGLNYFQRWFVGFAQSSIAVVVVVVGRYSRGGFPRSSRKSMYLQPPSQREDRIGLLPTRKKYVYAAFEQTIRTRTETSKEL